MSHSHLAALALAAVTLAASGCGESSGTPGLTPTQLIAKADPICKRANAYFDSANISSPQGLLRSGSQVATYERQAATELADLKPPSSMSGNWKTIVDGFQTLSKDVSELAAGAKTNNNLAANAPIISNLTSAQSQRVAAATTDGFKDCAKY